MTMIGMLVLVPSSEECATDLVCFVYVLVRALDSDLTDDLIERRRVGKD